MESFLEVRDKFNFSFPQMFNSVMLSLKKEIIELNQVEQLSEGIDALGQKIVSISAKEQGQGNVYSVFTIQERQAQGLQTNKVDLKQEGTLWKSFKLVKVTGGWEVIVNWTVNGEDVREHFDSSFDFAGLTKENLEFLVQFHVIPELTKRIKQQTGI